MNTVTAWDHLQKAVDHLADTLGDLLHEPDDLIGILPAAQIGALANVLNAGLHTDLAARLIHRWVLLETDSDPHRDELLTRWNAASDERTESTGP